MAIFKYVYGYSSFTCIFGSHRIDQVRYEALKISHIFSMDDSGMQTCLQHVHICDIRKKGPGVGECKLMIFILLHL